MSLADDLRALQNHGAEDKRCREGDMRIFASEEHRAAFEAALAEVAEQEEFKARLEAHNAPMLEAKRSREPPEGLRPPEEYAGEVGFHWIDCRGEPEVAEWQDCGWLRIGVDYSESPEGLWADGYRYLGPAVYVPPKW